MELEKDAQTHIKKTEKTIEYLETKVNDQSLDQRRRDFIAQDIAAYKFLLEYAKEALAQRGIRVQAITMSDMLTYDKDGKKIPSQEFLSMVIILLRKAGKETGGESLLMWLSSLAEDDDDALRKAVYKILKENYLDKENAAPQSQAIFNVV